MTLKYATGFSFAVKFDVSFVLLLSLPACPVDCNYFIIFMFVNFFG